MNVYYQGKAAAALDAKIAFATGPGARKLADRVAEAVVLGNETDRLSGVDRHGRPQTPVKPRKGRYAGMTGPPLAPKGRQSRVVANFRAVVSGSGPFKIVAGWEGVLSDRGVPFLPFHEEGVRGGGGGGAKKAAPARKGGLLARVFKAAGKLFAGGGGWRIPPRPIFGVSPRTWRAIDSVVGEFKRSLKGVKR